MLELCAVSKAYPGPAGLIRAVQARSLTVSAGEVVAVRGPSGCGKTTLLLLAGGLLQPDEGEVRLAGQNVYALPTEARAKLRAERVGFVFQQYHLVPYLTVRENIAASSLVQPVPELSNRVDRLLNELGLAERAHHLPSALSVGQKQRTAVARALLAKPQLVLADEPTGNLDPANAEAVLNALTRAAQNGAGVLLVTHDPHAASRAQRVLDW